MVWAGAVEGAGGVLLVLVLLLQVLQLQVLAGASGRSSEDEVFKFGVRGAKDVQLYKQIIDRRTGLFRERCDSVRYPLTGVTKNVVTYVEVHMPRGWLQDEVRVTGGGPGMNYVSLNIGGHRGRRIKYTFLVFGKDVENSSGLNRIGRKLPHSPGPAQLDGEESAESDVATAEADADPADPDQGDSGAGAGAGAADTIARPPTPTPAPAPAPRGHLGQGLPLGWTSSAST